MKLSSKSQLLVSLLFLAGLIIPGTGNAAGTAQAPAKALKAFLTSTPKANEVLFTYLGNSGIILKVADQTILIDPFDSIDTKTMDTFGAAGINLILYSHAHGDHLNLPAAQQLYARFKSFVVCEQGLVAKFEQKIPEDKLMGATPGKALTAGKINIDIIEGKHIGAITLFRITVDEITIFHAGDSGYVPLKDYPSQVAFLPVGGASPTASPDDALKMVADLNPQAAAVFHGKEDQYTSFKSKMASKYPKTKVLVCKVNESGKITVTPAATATVGK